MSQSQTRTCDECGAVCLAAASQSVSACPRVARELAQGCLAPCNWDGSASANLRKLEGLG